MLVREKMVLTILQVSLAFAAVAEGQLRIRDLRPSADGTFVLGNAGARPRLAKLCLKFLLAFPVLSCNMNAGKPEKQKHIGNGHYHLGAGHKTEQNAVLCAVSTDGIGKNSDNLIPHVNQLDYQHPFHLDGQHKKQENLSLRHTHSQC